MAESIDPGGDPTARGNHFSCSLTAVLIARVHAFGGDEAVGRLLREARSEREPAYLVDIGNWVSYDEAIALWGAGAKVTRHPQFARALGEDAARRLNASPVAAVLRSLGSPEEVYRQIATTASKFSTATNLEAVETGPGYTEIVAVAAEGFPRNAHHCAWTPGCCPSRPCCSGWLRRWSSMRSVRRSALRAAATPGTPGRAGRPARRASRSARCRSSSRR